MSVKVASRRLPRPRRHRDRAGVRPSCQRVLGRADSAQARVHDADQRARK